MQELKNYKKEKLTVDLVWANVFGILILIPIVLFFGLPYYLIWSPSLDIKAFLDSLNSNAFGFGLAIVSGLIILGIIIHEILHGITWALFTQKGLKSIKFGILWKMLTPYCHCKEPLSVQQYIIGAITPAIILGVLPCIIAIATESIPLLIFGMFFTMASAGDFLIINLVRKERITDLVQDHPSEAGCYIYRKIE